jgi:Tol biopolymer transport system component
MSPDGRKLALVLDGEGKAQIWVRDLNSFVTRALPGTEGSTGVFWSPDSQSLGFFANGRLMRTDLQGSRTQVLADSFYGLGGAWSPDGVIVFTPYYGQGLFRVSAGGGTPVPLTRLDPAGHEVVHTRALFLPDGQHILFLDRIANGPFRICWTTLGSGKVTPVLEADALVGYSDPGYILFVRRGSLLAQVFDPVALKLKGDPFVVAEHVGYRRGDDAALATLSQSGVVAFQTNAFTDSQFVIFDRSGRRVRTVGPVAPYFGFSLAPDEKQFVVARPDPVSGGTHLWTADLERDTFTRLNTAGEGEIQPIWSPDGSRIVFSSDRDGLYGLFHIQSSGAGGVAALLPPSLDSVAFSFAPDGKSLVYLTYDSAKGQHAWVLPVAAGAPPVEFLPNEKVLSPAVSPDGHWVAYQEEDSGRPEVYVTSFPTPGGKTQVSVNGGSEPRWRRDGKELFYIAPGDKLTAVDVIPGARVQFGIPHELFPMPEHASGILWLDSGIFEAFDNGQHFLIHEHVDITAHQPVRVLLNWVPAQKR